MSEKASEHAAVDGPVLVIGTGLIGTSIALALSRAGVDVALEDADASALQEAVYRGAGSVLTDHEPSIVVVAVPPAVAASQMADASRRFDTATIPGPSTHTCPSWLDTFGSGGVIFALYHPLSVGALPSAVGRAARRTGR